MFQIFSEGKEGGCSIICPSSQKGFIYALILSFSRREKRTVLLSGLLKMTIKEYRSFPPDVDGKIVGGLKLQRNYYAIKCKLVLERHKLMKKYLGILALVLIAFLMAGCKIETHKPVVSQQSVELTVSRENGKSIIYQKKVNIGQGDTVYDILARNATVETQYGGGFVRTINNIASGRINGKPHDWFYYVNGTAPNCSAKAYKVSAGDKINWDYHEWSK